MGDVRIRVRQRKNGQNVYEYSFKAFLLMGNETSFQNLDLKRKKKQKRQDKRKRKNTKN